MKALLSPWTISMFLFAALMTVAALIH